MRRPLQSAPVERTYMRLVIGKRGQPPRLPGAPPLPARFGRKAGNYLLELTVFYSGDGR